MRDYMARYGMLVVAAYCVLVGSLLVVEMAHARSEPADEQTWTPITSDKVASEIEMTPALRRVAMNAIAFSFEVHIQLLAPDPAHPIIYFRKGKGTDEVLFAWDYGRQCTVITSVSLF